VIIPNSNAACDTGIPKNIHVLYRLRLV